MKTIQPVLEKKIDLAEYKLRYFRKTDQKVFFVKRASSTDYVLVDPETLKKSFFTQSNLRKEYWADVDLNKGQRKGLSISA